MNPGGCGVGVASEGGDVGPWRRIESWATEKRQDWVASACQCCSQTGRPGRRSASSHCRVKNVQGHAPGCQFRSEHRSHRGSGRDDHPAHRLTTPVGFAVRPAGCRGRTTTLARPPTRPDPLVCSCGCMRMGMHVDAGIHFGYTMPSTTPPLSSQDPLGSSALRRCGPMPQSMTRKTSPAQSTTRFVARAAPTLLTCCVDAASGASFRHGLGADLLRPGRFCAGPWKEPHLILVRAPGV